MISCFVSAADASSPAVPVFLVRQSQFDADVSALPEAARRFVSAAGFRGEAAQTMLAPGADGAVAAFLIGVGAGDDPIVIGAGARAAPEGVYAFEGLAGIPLSEAVLAWARGAYAFTRYKSSATGVKARLVLPETDEAVLAHRLAEAFYRVRDLVNTPAADMGPQDLEAVAREIAEAHGASVRVTTGDALLEENYPLIHAVGRAADQEPRLIELEWGDPSHPRVAIVGKGVTFDTGGLNIKVGEYMRLMKKDMGGAAHALGLAQLIMASGLSCRLHMLVPAVENSISDEAFRPGDILDSRAGLTVEVENTDAEGRLVLADALTRAGEDEPELVIDFATLTGAARVAMGADVAPFYTDDETLASDLMRQGGAVNDAVWRLPLHKGYRPQLKSPIADLKNLGDTPLGGSILAALFLQRFVKDETPWAHFDVYAWNPGNRPQGPKGGEAQGLRAVFGVLAQRYPAQG